MKPVVIIGSGIAGYTLAREFRKHDKSRPLMVVTRDAGHSYSKPMLSNALGKGKSAEQLVMADADKMMETLDAEIKTDTIIAKIDAEKQVLYSDNGETIEYDKLVLATGAESIVLDTFVDMKEQLFTINNLDDFARFSGALTPDSRPVIIGAGLIGCEFANDLATQQFPVHVIDLSPQPLGRLLPAHAASWFRTQLEAAGIHFHLQTSVTSTETFPDHHKLTLDDGTILETNLVLLAVGLKPATELAKSAGIKTGNGIVVDRLLATSANNIYALGDCCEINGMVLPFIMPIMTAARALAQTLAGTPTEVSYPAMPVVVKTPACPTVVAPPAPSTLQSGKWQEEATENGVKSLFFDEAGNLAGFALVGDAVAEKMTLTKELPALF